MTAPYDRIYEDDAVGQNRERIVKLENASPGSIAITDGITTVNPLLQLDIGAGLVLTDLGSGEASVKVSDYTTYTPVVTALTVNPTLGAGSATSGFYIKINKLVHCFGSVVLGTGPSLGTGQWFITLPVAESNLNLMGQAVIFSSPANQILNMNVDTGTESSGSTSQMIFPYSDAFPIGNRVLFGSASAWTPALNDSFYWNVVYRAA